jgi:hypothetical protein
VLLLVWRWWFLAAMTGPPVPEFILREPKQNISSNTEPFPPRQRLRTVASTATLIFRLKTSANRQKKEIFMPRQKLPSGNLTEAGSLPLQGAAISPYAGSAKALFVPPYLNYRNPVDKVAIDKLVAAAVAKGNVRRKKWQLLNATTQSSSSAALADSAAIFASGTSTDPILVSTSATKTGDTKSRIAKPMTPTHGSMGQKVASGGQLSVIPSSVTTPWWCPFQVEVMYAPDLSAGSYQVWSQTWWLVSGSTTHYLGDGISNSLNVTLDGPTYFPSSQSGNYQFVIRTNVATSNGDIEIFTDPVLVLFSNATPCVHLQSASLFGESAPCKLKGGNHGDRPKIEVMLDSPAGPSGQPVFLSYDDPHQLAVVTWFNNSFVIPFGQNSGQLEGFLGTRNVMSEKTISITASVNGQASQPLTIIVED